MTINYINIGSSANKGDGDTLRTAFRKINENFAFLSTSSGFISTGSSTSLSISPDAPSTATDGTLWFNSTEARTFVRYNGAWVDASPQITPPPTTSTETIITMGSVPPDTGEGTLWFNVNDARTYINYSGAWIDSSPQVTPPSVLPADNIGVLANDGNGNLYWTTASITASTGTNVDFLAVGSSILPSSDLTYDLGSLSKQWRSLYVGTSTIYIGGVAVSINTVSNTLVVGTSTQAVTLATEDYVATQIAAIPTTESYIGAGNLTVTAGDTINYVIAGTGVSTSTVIFNFRIHGSVGGVQSGVSDPDYVTITTGAQPVSEIYLTKYVSVDNRAFFAVQQGDQWTIPQDQVTPEMLAYSHFGINGVQVGQNILNGFGPLEPNTTYTFWIQQIGTAVTEYVFSTNRFDTGGLSPLFYSQDPAAPTTITPTTTIVGGELDPALTLIRGYKYTFDINASGQPFWIMTTSTYNIMNGYTHGVTNNGTSTGILTFTVPGNAPDTLYYISENSSLSMKGVINISDVSTSGTPDRLVNGANEVVLGADGKLTTPSGLQIGGSNGYTEITNTGSLYIVNTGLDQLAIMWSAGDNELPDGFDVKSTDIFAGPGGLDIEIINEADVSHSWNFNGDGSLTAPGHVLPDTDLAYDLGSTSSQWRSIYVGTGTVYIGGVALGVNQDNYVTVDGNPIITVNTASGALSIQGNTNIVLGAVAVSDTAPEASTTGSQWFDTVEGRTYIAINGVWLDASPTVVPTPETYLGNIAIDGSILNINGGTLTISNTGTLLVNGAEVTGSSSGDRLVNGDYQVVLDQDGVLNLPRRGVIRNLSNYDVNVVGAGPNGFAQLQWTTLAGAAEDNPNGTDELLHWIYLEEPGVFIETNVNGSGDSYEWKFGTDGSLEFPEGAAISSVMGVFRLTPPAASSSTQALLIYPTVADGNHVHLTAGGGETDLYLGNDDQFVKIDHSGTVVVQTYSTTTTSTWVFGTDGVLTLPEATPVIKGGGTGTDVTVVATTGSNTSTWVFAADGTLTTPQSSSIFALGTDFTGTIIGGNGTGGGYIRVESNTGAPNFSPAPIGTSFYNFLLTLTAGKQFTIHTVVDGTTYNTVVSFTEFGSGTSPAENANRSDLYFTKVSGDELPFSYSATELTLTFTSNSIVVNPESITFPDATVQTTAYLSGQQTVYVNTASTVTNIVLTELTGSIIEITPEDGYTVTGETHNVYLPFQFMGTNPNIPLGTRVTIINKYDGPVYVGGWPDFGFPVIPYASVDMVYHYDRVYGGNVWWVTNSFVWD